MIVNDLMYIMYQNRDLYELLYILDGLDFKGKNLRGYTILEKDAVLSAIFFTSHLFAFLHLNLKPIPMSQQKVSPISRF